ncbi:MAG: hypothetical protein U1D33_00780, partial [bacterium]|nr:hypothetical protein [bacterium]
DRAWVKDLTKGPLDMVIGAVEQYGDKVRGFMASLTGAIQIRDPKSEGQLEVFKQAFGGFEAALPVGEPYRKPVDQRTPPPLSAAENLMAGGDLLGGEILARAYNQPNDSEVRTDTGLRIVVMQNIGDTRDDKNRFSQALVRLAFDEKQRTLVTAAGARTFVVLHELSHGHGTEYVVGQPEVEALKSIGSDLRTTFEELKADIVGLFDAQTALTQKLISEQLFKEIYVTYIARCLGVILSLGTQEAHAKGALVALNYFLEQGAITIDPETGKTKVDLEKMCFTVQEFCRLLLTIKGDGDRAQAVGLYEKQGKTVPQGFEILAQQLTGLPKNIIVQYAFADLLP